MMEKHDLVASIRNELGQQGIAKTVKMELKKEICRSLLSERNGLLPSKGRKLKSLEHAAIRSLIMECIVFDGMKYTESVYSSESGLDEYRLSVEEILSALKIPSRMYDLIVNEAGESLECNSVKKSALYQILKQVPKIITKGSRSNNHISTQTLQTPEMYFGIDPSSLTETKMYTFFKECEERENKRMEKEMEGFKRSTTASLEKTIRMELNQNIESMKRKEDQLKLEFLKMDEEKERKNLAQQQKLIKEIELLRQQEKENSTFIDMEKRKLKLEEQRVNHILMNAEAKLEFADTKEKRARENAANEVTRVRRVAEESFGSASESIRKQSALHAKELNDLNVLRKEMASQLMKGDSIQLEASKLRINNANLKRDFDKAVAEKEEFKSLSIRLRNDLCEIKELHSELELKVKHSIKDRKEHKQNVAELESKVKFLDSELMGKDKLLGNLLDVLSDETTHYHANMIGAHKLPVNLDKSGERKDVTSHFCKCGHYAYANDRMKSFPSRYDHGNVIQNSNTAFVESNVNGKCDPAVELVDIGSFNISQQRRPDLSCNDDHPPLRNVRTIDGGHIGRRRGMLLKSDEISHREDIARPDKASRSGSRISGGKQSESPASTLTFDGGDERQNVEKDVLLDQNHQEDDDYESCDFEVESIVM